MKAVRASVTSLGVSLLPLHSMALQGRLDEESSGMGLANIKARYEFLSDKPVVVEKTESYFRVKLPLLSISE